MNQTNKIILPHPPFVNQSDNPQVARRMRDFHNGDFQIDTKTVASTLAGLRYLFNLKYKGGSAYGPISTPNGIMGLRLSEHNASGKNFEKDVGDFYVSIYIEQREFPHVDTPIPYREFRFPKEVFAQDGKAVVDAIVGIVETAIETGEAVDNSGLSITKDYPVEISAEQPPPQQPAGAGVTESLATIYTKGNNMKYKNIAESAKRVLMEQDGKYKFEPYAELPNDYPDEYLPSKKDPESLSVNDDEKKYRRFVVEYRLRNGGLTYGQYEAPNISKVLHILCDIEGRDESEIIAIVDTKESYFKTRY